MARFTNGVRSGGSAKGVPAAGEVGRSGRVAGRPRGKPAVGAATTLPRRLDY